MNLARRKRAIKNYGETMEQSTLNWPIANVFVMTYARSDPR
jgi:hypothetical protein